MKKNALLILAVGDPLLTREALEKKLPVSHDNAYRFYAKDADWTSILEQARTFPFLAEKQVVWIKQAELIDEETTELLEKYFEDPAPFTFFFFESETFSGKRKFIDWISRQGGEVIQFESESKWKKQTEQVRSFIRQKLKVLKLQATPGALKMIEESCGEHFILLDNTLEKLSLNVGDSGTITEKEVEALADQIDDRTGFDLAEALASKKMTKVFEIYFQLYEDNPYQSGELLGLLNWQIRKIYEGKRLMKKGASKQELASKLKMSPYFMDRFITNVQSFDERKLKNAFNYLLETDEAVKTGKVAVGAALETLLLRLGLS
ncbi:MAG: DNA polymerase III subunit delta [Candidatus Omnitrophica bacterium]|nr:DNA polymerase III subunit delta [Candidatus Omnitrophota bacterium]